MPSSSPSTCRRRGTKRGFTLVEILIVLAIVGILAAILLPAFNRVRSNARATSCASNLRQIGLAMRLYLGDHNGFYPDPARYGWGLGCSWPDRIFPYVRSAQAFSCPEAPKLVYKAGCAIDEEVDGESFTNDGGYDMSDLRDPAGSITIRPSETRMRNPSGTIIVLDGKGEWTQPTSSAGTVEIVTSGVPLRHSNGANALFADGHTKWMSLDALSRPSLWTIYGS